MTRGRLAAPTTQEQALRKREETRNARWFFLQSFFSFFSNKCVDTLQLIE